MSDHIAAAPAEAGYPEFAVRWRGYDKAQVDDYVMQLRRFLRDAERRAAEAHRRAEQLAAQHA